MILFPRRMLYVEAVLYVTVAVTAFGLGYLSGRGRPSAAKEDADVQKRVPVEGKVLLITPAGTRRGDEGAVVIVLPAGKLPDKRLPVAGLQPGDPLPAAGDATSSALAEYGAAASRADVSGEFSFFVPAAGSYRILVISRHAMREADEQSEQRDLSDLGNYFDTPADLLRRHRYRWQTRDLRLGAAPLNIEFPE
jgi:hypothetical protein